MTASLRAGAAKIDITPPSGGAMTGYLARSGYALGVHDPLFARALAFDDGTLTALYISCDVLGLDAPTSRVIREAVATATGVPAVRIMLAATHTHAGPACLHLRDCGEINAAYVASLPAWLAKVGRLAVDGLRPARLAFSTTTVEGISHNRRRLDGPHHPVLRVLWVDDAHGQPIATLANYACHPTIMGPQNRLFSAEYPGVVTRELEHRRGGVALFANGASGDIGPELGGRNFHEGETTFDDIELKGNALAEAALATHVAATPIAAAPLVCGGRDIDLPLLPTNTEDIGRWNAATPGNPHSAKYENAMRGWAHAVGDALQRGECPTTVKAEVQVITVGDFALAGVPGEFFCAMEQAIHQGSPKAHTMVSSYTNSDPGYLPARDEYPYGGYEVDVAFRYYDKPAGFAPEAAEMVVQTVLELLA